MPVCTQNMACAGFYDVKPVAFFTLKLCHYSAVSQIVHQLVVHRSLISYTMPSTYRGEDRGAGVVVLGAHLC